MDLRLKTVCGEFSRSGDLFVLLFRNDADGMSYLRFVTKDQIQKIDTAPNDWRPSWLITRPNPPAKPSSGTLPPTPWPSLTRLILREFFRFAGSPQSDDTLTAVLSETGPAVPGATLPNARPNDPQQRSNLAPKAALARWSRVNGRGDANGSPNANNPFNPLKLRSLLQ
jgi:hypothetical protein